MLVIGTWEQPIYHPTRSQNLGMLQALQSAENSAQGYRKSDKKQYWNPENPNIFEQLLVAIHLIRKPHSKGSMAADSDSQIDTTNM